MQLIMGSRKATGFEYATHYCRHYTLYKDYFDAALNAQKVLFCYVMFISMSQSGRQLPCLTVPETTMAASLGFPCLEALFQDRFFCSYSHCVLQYSVFDYFVAH